MILDGILTAFADPEHGLWDQESGLPTLTGFTTGFATWLALQANGTVTIKSAMMTWCASEAVIRSACAEHPFICVFGEGLEATIEMDGE